MCTDYTDNICGYIQLSLIYLLPSYIIYHKLWLPLCLLLHIIQCYTYIHVFLCNIPYIIYTSNYHTLTITIFINIRCYSGYYILGCVRSGCTCIYGRYIGYYILRWLYRFTHQGLEEVLTPVDSSGAYKVKHRRQKEKILRTLERAVCYVKSVKLLSILATSLATLEFNAL